ncbi:hypothetical protein [Proteus terrae]|uniref:hypothetical protein n=1 Tax=Proteus terrae TaxID=1574161 RepID=UPI00352581F9
MYLSRAYEATRQRIFLPDLLSLYNQLRSANYPHQLDPDDIFVDVLPEDGEVSEELYYAFEALNKVIVNHSPLSWSPIDKAVIVTLD